MSLSVFNKLRIIIHRIECNISALFFGKKFPPGEELCLANMESNYHNQPTSKTFSLGDIIGDGFLWAVPRNRRTIEKRWKRKFGHPEYVWKLMKPITNLQVCSTCGHDHEVGMLCRNCYDKVQKETKEMQDAIQRELQLEAIDKEVVVLYDGEKQRNGEFWQGKRIVEMNKPRPSWFSKNLLQKTTQPPATTANIKPSNLG